MNSKWTEEQLEAINSREGNLLVSAAAGAGKTAVLVERIVRRITDQALPVDVDRLLVVTFTNAAAAEMRERIGRALHKEIARRPGEGNLHRQVVLLGRACISTLHSFCLDLLRQHFYRLELDPAFRVADETEAALIQSEALEELFEKRYAAVDNRSFTALVDSYGGRRDDTVLQEMVLDAYKFARSTPDPGEWLNSLPAAFDLPESASFDQLPWSSTLKKALELELAGVLSGLEVALRLARSPGGPTAYLTNLEVERETINGLYRACTSGAAWFDLYQAFRGSLFGKLKGCKKGEADARLVEQVKKTRDAAKKALAGLQAQYFTRTPEELCTDLRTVAPLVGELAGLVHDFGEHYRQAKAARGVVDFNDLEHYCLQILTGQGPEGPTPSPVALELRQRFVEVMVDEYQDTNAVQEAILHMVSRQGENNPNLFMVGDVKQSIYRFRLADPGLFLGKYLRYPTERGDRERRLDLSRNFRSRRGVLNAVNFIFRQLMTPVVGEMTYDTKTWLVYGAGYPPAAVEAADSGEFVELHLIERDDSPAPKDSFAAVQPEDSENGDGAGEVEGEEDLDAVQKEARLISRRIRELMDGCTGNEPCLQIYDRELKDYRLLTFRDVVILLRATAGYANTFMEEFRREGIPAYAELATGYFEAVEVETVLSLLKVIDNPRQDVPLAAVLRSPLVGLKAGELAVIRLALRRGDFIDAVVATATSDPGDLSDRLLDFLKKLENWRTAARRGPLADLIWDLYRETGYYDFVGGLPGGGQRQANLRALHHRAQQYETTNFRGLFLFLRFIERVRDGGRDLGAARFLSEKENVVRIMSIHKSKGLEFPVVFVAGLGKRFNCSDLNRTMLFHKDLGLGPRLVDTTARFTYPTAARLALKHKLKMEALAEEMRVLYVALTRAREKLILVGSARNLPDCARHWCSQVGAAGWPLPDGDLAGARTFLDWLVPAVARHSDGLEIRKRGLCEVDPSGEVAEDSSSWRVIFNESLLRTGTLKEPDRELFAKIRQMEPLETNGPLAKTIKARLEWSYPGTDLLGRAAKVSVTEMKRRFDALDTGEEQVQRDFRPPIGNRPLFMQEERGLTVGESGTALHLVMQHLNWKSALDSKAIKEQIDCMVEKELLTCEQAEAVPVEQIAAFFEGPLGSRVLAAHEVLRELPFSLFLPAGEIYPGLIEYPGERVLVQGVLDCLVDEGDGYILIDYKTDRLHRDQLEQVVNRYRGQLSIYARAVEEILNRMVKEKYLYLFSVGQSIRCM